MSEKIRILFTGDSITDTYRTATLNDVSRYFAGYTEEQRQRAVNEIMGQGYPTMVQGQLLAEEPGKYEIINRGISGNRVVDLDARVKADCINLQPDVLSIMIGINDVWHEIGNHNGVSAAKYRRVYDGMLEEIAESLPGIRLILMEPYVLKGTATVGAWETFAKETELRRTIVRELAEKYHATLIESQKLFDEAAARSCAEDWCKDGVHPTPAGHWLLAREWVKTFRTLALS